jgi:Domain of unknown function (DUF5122) beta-propeller
MARSSRTSSGAATAGLGPATASWRLSRLLAGIAVATFLLVGPTSSPAYGSPSTTATPGASIEGVVYASVQVGDRTFIGGEFAKAGQYARLNAAAVLANGKIDSSWNPQVNGRVLSMTASADGSIIYLGGKFTTVGTTSRAHLAAVDATTGAVLGAWKTRVAGPVWSLAISQGRLYVGGVFGQIGGQDVPNLAKLNASTGAVDTSFRPAPSARVRGLTVSSDGTKLYAGGGFGSIAGVARKGAAELNASTGDATSFNPAEGGAVIAVELSTDDSRLLFSTSDNITRAYDPAVSNLPVYEMKTSGDVQCILEHQGEVYIGGHFGSFNQLKLVRLRLASFDLDTGAPTDWSVVVDQKMGAWTFQLGPSYLSVGGAFAHIDGVRHRGYARFAFS